VAVAKCSGCDLELGDEVTNEHEAVAQVDDAAGEVAFGPLERDFDA
jgi:hypothetical protein